MVKGGGEDHRRAHLNMDRFQHIEAIPAWHLDIEHQQVWFLLENLAYGLGSVAALCHHFNIALLRQKGYKFVAGKRFIFSHDRSNTHRPVLRSSGVAVSWLSGSICKGMTILTTAPRPDGLESSNDCSCP